MNWDFINRKLKEFFEQRKQQSIDKLFTLNTFTDAPKKQFLELETQVTEDPKQQNLIPTSQPLLTPTKPKQTPKSFSQISHLFSPHGPARSTASMQMRQIVASTLKNEANSYNSVRTKDIKKVQQLVGSNSIKPTKHRKLIKQQSVFSQKILSEFDDQLDNSPTHTTTTSSSLKTFITQTKNINTLAMRAQLKMKSQGSIRKIQQPSPALDNFTKLAFGKSTDPRVGLDRFLSNKWLQFVIEQKSMRKDDQFNEYLQKYNDSPLKQTNLKKLKSKQEIRQQFNAELPQQVFKPHRYTPVSNKQQQQQQKQNVLELGKSYSQTVFDIEKKRDDEELIEFYPNYYEKKVKRRRIKRKLKVLAKIAVKNCVSVYQLLQQFQQLVPYQQPGSVAFLRFVRYNNIQAVKQLLDQDIKLISSFNELGQYAIHLATMIQSIDMVKLLINYGANVNSEDFFQQKPLYFSLINNQLNMVKLLLACRASPWDDNLRDYFACCRSEEAKQIIKLAQYLRIYGKDPECLLEIENIKEQLNQY